MSEDERYQHAFEVARNLVAYHNYGEQRSKALAALRRRTPGWAPEARSEALDLLCAIVRTALDAVPRHVRPDRDRTRPFAKFEDIDFDACLAEIDTHQPGVAAKAKRAALSWAVLWGYLM